MIWNWIEKFSVIATVVGFPLTVVGLAALYVSWSRNLPNIGYILSAVTIVIGLLAYTIDLSDRFGWFKPTTFERVVGRTFHNQTVNIDGNLFEDCTFENIIFRYGGGQFGFVRANIKGTKSFETYDLGATGTVNLLKMLQFLETDFANSWKSKPLEDFK